MRTINFEVTLDQLMHAIRRLSPDERHELVQTLLKDERDEITRRFDDALSTSRSANPETDEDALMEEINQVVHQVRAERRIKNRR